MPYTYKELSSNKYSDESVYSPSTEDVSKQGLSNTVRKKLNFNLNRDVGVGGYEKNSAKYFDRFYSVYPDYELKGVCQYVFFVRPDLNILDSNGDLVTTNSSPGPNSSPHIDSTFIYLKKRFPELLENLSGRNFLGNHAFMPFLVGRTESLNLPDYTLKDYKMTQPFTDYNLPYASHALSSQTGGQFEVSFRDDGNLRIHKLFSAWTYYISGVTRNIFVPRKTYLKYNVMDYATSIYCITCKEDAKTIIHWFKYTGCFPTSCPNSDQSFNLRGGANNKITIPFDYFRASDPLDPMVIIDFNKNAGFGKGNEVANAKYTSIYNSESLDSIGMKKGNSKTWYGKANSVLGTGNGLVGAPFIVKVGKGVHSEYELRWKKISNLSPS